MDKKFSEIIIKGLEEGKSYDEINKMLAEAGANFHLDDDGKVPGWSEAEMAEGFKPGKEAKKVQREVDMSRKKEFAGTVQEQVVLGVTYKVHYNEDGYAVKATRV